MSNINTAIRIKDLIFKNPVITASGTFGYGEEFKDFYDVNELGGVVTKTISLHPKRGNPPQRIVETPSGMLNAIGLQNPGVDVFINDKLPFLSSLTIPKIVSIAGSTIEDYVEVTKRLETVKEVDAIELNISCPNVKKGGIQFGQDPEQVALLTKTIRECTTKLLIVKLSPNVSNIVEMAQAAEQEQADAVSLINTLIGMAIDLSSRKPILANVTGGLSGPAIKPIALRMVWQVYQNVKIPIIGMGGIMNARDALEFIVCGASLVSVGTANFVNPCAAHDIVKGIEEYMQENKIKDIQSMIGTLEIEKKG